MPANGHLRDAELRSDLAVGHAVGQPLEHFALPDGERLGLLRMQCVRQGDPLEQVAHQAPRDGRFPGDRATHDVRQPVRRRVLGQEAAGAGANSGHGSDIRLVGGEDDQRGVGELLARGGQHRHHVVDLRVDEHGVGAMRQDRAQRSHRFVGLGDHADALGLQRAAHGHPDEG